MPTLCEHQHWHCATQSDNTGLPIPALRRKATTDKLLIKATTHEDWGLYDDITNPPTHRLLSRHPMWEDMLPQDINTRWREEWKSALVVNSYMYLVDHAIWQPGFDLPRRQWCLLNRFHTA